MDTILKVSGIKKHFDGMWALTQADLVVATGEVHALVGENGAGKSTLVKIISGVILPDAGRMTFNGSSYSPVSPRNARLAGVEVVAQHLSLAPNLTVFENLFMGREQLLPGGIINRRLMINATNSLLETIGFADITAKAKVGSLSVSQKYRTEIAKALLVRPRLLILDEPTAALNIEETETLYKLVESLRAEKRSVIWITHRMEELFRIANRTTVMRDGQYVDTRVTNTTTEDTLIELMSGREIAPTSTTEHKSRPISATYGLEVTDLRTPKQLAGLSMAVHKGEILGIGGLDGSGIEEIAPAIMGLVPKAEGRIGVLGKNCSIRRLTPYKMYGFGAFYLPADRQTNGLISSRPVSENTSISSLGALTRTGFLMRFEENRKVAVHIEKLRIKARSPKQDIERLSGGNQQKVLFARGAMSQSSVFVLEEPTQGVDVRAKSEIYGIVRELAREGNSILVISTDTRELLSLCNRILTVNSGRLSGEFTQGNVSEQDLVSAYFTKPDRYVRAQDYQSGQAFL